MLNKTDLLGISLKRKKVKLEVGEVLIKEFTTADREVFEMSAMNLEEGAASNIKSKLIAISLINPDGTRVFGDDELHKISQMPSTVTETIFNEILALNSMKSDSMEEAEGN